MSKRVGVSATSTATRVIDGPRRRNFRISWWIAAAGAAALVASVYGGFEYARRKTIDDEARRKEAVRATAPESKRKEEVPAKKELENADAARVATPERRQGPQDDPFVIVEGQAVFGRSITSLRNTDVETCKSACIRTSGCVAFELGQSSGLCILFATTNATRPMSGFVSGTRASVTPATKQ